MNAQIYTIAGDEATTTRTGNIVFLGRAPLRKARVAVGWKRALESSSDNLLLSTYERIADELRREFRNKRRRHLYTERYIQSKCDQILGYLYVFADCFNRVVDPPLSNVENAGDIRHMTGCREDIVRGRKAWAHLCSLWSRKHAARVRTWLSRALHYHVPSLFRLCFANTT